MTSDTSADSTQRTVWPAWLAAIGLALPILYLSSLAPAWRLVQPPKHSGFHRFYDTAFVIMERTPLRSPVLAWCAAWGVREKVERHLERREIEGIFDDPSGAQSL